MSKKHIIIFVVIFCLFLVINIMLNMWISHVSSEVNRLIDEEVNYESVEKVSYDEAFDMYYVSISQLISNPQKYNQKKVTVIGYFKLDGEEALYFTEFSCRNNITKDGVMLYLGNEKISHYPEKDVFLVIAEGTFVADDGGIHNDYSGSLNNIMRFECVFER